MKIVRDGSDERDDEQVRDALRAVYAAPTDEGYWLSLERRILARVRGEVPSPIEWWSYFRGWRHIGIAAAVVAALIAGLAAYRTHETSERIAYRDLLGTPSELPLLSETVGEPLANTRDATLRYLLRQ
jgi:hypothetical protein